MKPTREFYRRNGEHAAAENCLFAHETAYGDVKIWAGPQQNADESDYLITCLDAVFFFSYEFDGCFERGKLTDLGEEKIETLFLDEYSDQIYEQMVDDYYAAAEYDKRDEARKIESLRQAMYNR